MTILYLAILAGLIVFFAILFVFWGLWWRGKKSFGLDYKLLRIKLVKPDADKSQQTDWKDFINRSEQLFSSLASIKQPIIFEAAVHNRGQDIHFYLAVPNNQMEFAKRQIEGLFLDAQIEAALNDYTIFDPQGMASSAYLRLQSRYVLPLRTYRLSEIDTFAPILSTLSKLAENGEGAAIQLVIRPAPKTAKKNVLSAASELRRGKKIKEVLNTGQFNWLTVREVFNEKKTSDKPPVIDEEAVKLVEQKANKPLLAVNLRLVTAASNSVRTETLLSALTDSFLQLTSPRHNELVIVKPRRVKKLVNEYIFRFFNPKEQIILNTEELASLFHLPTPSTDVPRVNWARTAEAPPPLNLPAEGVILGESVFRDEHRLVRLTADDRRRHLYIIGQTGTGKSYLLLNLAIQDIAEGRGLAVIDPHGDLIEKLLSYIPPERAKDVIVFDPGDLERPLGLNMLEYDFNHPEQKTFIINEMLNIFNQLFDMKLSGGPLFERFMRGSLRLLMDDAKTEPPTLTDLPRVFADTAYRERKLARVTDPTLIDFWTKEATKTTGDWNLANMSAYILSKFDNFISNDYVRPIIGQVKSAFNSRVVIDDGKILLVNLSKGRIGDLNASLLGMIITGRLLFAALSRVDLPENERRDFYLYIDEFQNFTTESIATILSEARKYKLDLILAHQFIAQLKDEIREAVFGNVGSLISFRVGTPDTETLIKSFEPTFTANDLTTIENRQAFIKLLIQGEPSRPFKFRTLNSPAGSSERAAQIKELSRLTYGRPRAEVENEILTRYRS